MLMQVPRVGLCALCLCVAVGCIDRKLAPLQPCLVTAVDDSIQTERIDKVDLLFVVDNSGSMKQEQAALRREFPELIRVLTTGDRDNDGTPEFSPATDLHLGVVSTNLGLPGLGTIVEKCEGLGDDAALQSTPSKEVSGCEPSYPAFLKYSAGVETPDKVANDFACVATLGIDGCGYEQQLEAGLKALWPSDKADPKSDPIFLSDENGFGALGQGDRANRGFVRSAEEGLSVVAVIVVTDEDDCSSSSTEQFVPQDYLLPASPYFKQDKNQRCFLNKDKLYDIDRYLKGLRALRPGREDLVIFAGIVGVPTDLVDETALGKVDFKDAGKRDRFYQGILDDQRMQEVLVPSAVPGEADRLRTSCGGAVTTSAQPGTGTAMADEGEAFPPRRIVELARAFGENGIVQSICQPDFTPAMQAIIALIAKRLGSVCLPRPLVRNSQGVVGCEVVWELPAATALRANDLTECSQRPFLKDMAPASGAPAGSKRCRVQQVAVAGEPMRLASNDGWYYDDFEPERMQRCAPDRPQRIAFTRGAAAPNGVTIKLQCLDERQSVTTSRVDVDPSTHPPSSGDACKMMNSGGAFRSADAACEVVLTAPTAAWPDGVDRSMFCHPEQNVCARACGTSADCPAAWTCDDRPETVAATSSPTRPNGSAYCINPTCGSGR